ncbi:MAG: TetR/AcrR family transcriptional regulator, transcriptional repressor for nem operon, partial [Thermodesulfobacteriota bacterium]|nr:TetR/AcrR family transcriptional regulator, transcriptional repressor for nem operon [Thermodesulfobacteriota bacterium]
HAARIIRKNGFNNTGIAEILSSAGVPKGSFYFYFKSKEDLGLALVDYYYRVFSSMGEPLLRESDTSPRKRLEKFFRAFETLFESEDWKSGCPLGNLTQEMGTLNPAFRLKLKNGFNGIKQGLEHCLEEAKRAGEMETEVDVGEIANFILNSWEGAILRMKAEGNTESLAIFRRVIFGTLLKLPSGIEKTTKRSEAQ